MDDSSDPGLVAQNYGNPLPTSGGGSPSAGYREVQPKAALGCGGFEWKVGWVINGGNANTNGFLVQRVTMSAEQYRCRNREFVGWGVTYWEAWQVQAGQVVSKSGLPGVDTFRISAQPDTYGLNFEEGYAKYLDGYTEPLTWGSHPFAGGTWATTSPPAGWSDSGAIHRWVQNDYNCCSGATDSAVTGSD